MASGKITLSKPSGSKMSGYIAWSSTSNGSAANTSTVKATLYMKRYDGYTTTGTFSGSLTINGTKKSISRYGSWKNSYVAVGSATKTVAHNADGKKSIKISTSVSNTGTSQAGTYSASGTAVLDTIPRASSISSSASWTAGNSLTVSISRKSSSFTHSVSVTVNGTTVASATGVKTSVTFSNKAFHTKVFKALAQRGSKTAKITVRTYSGSTAIGSAASVSGTVTAPAASTLSLKSTVAVGEAQSFSISRKSTAFYHKLRYSFAGTSGYIIGTSSVPGSAVTNDWIVPSSFYALMKDKAGDTCSMTLTTYYAGATTSGAAEYVQVRSSVSKSFTVTVKDSQPVFADFDVFDSNEVTKALTMDDNTMIAGYSTLTAVIEPENKAIPRNSAQMSHYALEVGGVSKSAAYSDTDVVSISVPNVKGSTVNISAYDSRNLYTKVSKTVEVKPYNPVAVESLSVDRINGVDTRTVLTMDVSMWDGDFCETISNGFTECKYTYKRTGEQEWIEPYKTITLDKLVYDEQNKLYHLSEEISGDHSDGFALAGSYDVKVVIADKLDSVEATGSINSGYPGIYLKRMDTTEEDDPGYQVGINCVPDDELGEGLHVAGRSVTLNGAEIGMPIGSVMVWCTEEAPAGWLILNGTAVSRTEYSELFAVLGTTYGEGDGSATFNLPDMKGRVAVGKGTTTAFNTIGKKAGTQTHTLTTTQIPAHTHGSAGSHYHSIPNTATGIDGTIVRAESWAKASDSKRTLNTASAGTHTHASVGGSGAHNNLQPYIVLNYIIKAK